MLAALEENILDAVLSQRFTMIELGVQTYQEKLQSVLSLQLQLAKQLTVLQQISKFVTGAA